MKIYKEEEIKQTFLKVYSKPIPWLLFFFGSHKRIKKWYDERLKKEMRKWTL